MEAKIKLQIQEISLKINKLQQTLAQRELEIKVLEKENFQLKNLLKEAVEKIEGLEETNKFVKLAEGIQQSKQDLKTVKQEINRQIREIDECIRLLNQ